MRAIRVRAAAAAFALCLGLGLVACSLADGRGASHGGGAPDFADVRARIEEMVARGAPSVAVAVVMDGAILWEEAFGFEDVAARKPATPHSRYPIGSVSKPFTATAIMILAERGEIDLSAPANRYLSRAWLLHAAGGADQATVRDLLQHRAGLPSPHVSRFYQDEARQVPTVEETIRRYGVIVDRPGQRFGYSNLGYGVLGAIAAQAARMPLSSFLAREVFGPLGLSDTTLETGAVPVRPAVTLYHGGRPVPAYRGDEEGSGRVWSSAHDLARFALFHLGEPLADQRPVLSERGRLAMATDTRPSGTPGARWGPDWFYGLGWGGREATEHNAARWYGHDGSVPGAAAELRLVPDHRLAVVVLANDHTVPTKQILELVLDAVIPGHAWARQEDAGGRPGRARRFAAPAELVGSWAGEIRTWNGVVAAQLDIRTDGARIQIGTGPAMPLDSLELFDGRLRGRSGGRLPLPDLGDLPYELWYELRRDGDSLVGAAFAADTAPLRHFVLPSWMKLRRQPR
jgi:CubicO group peptidase (beta-lactamase class C family)